MAVFDGLRTQFCSCLLGLDSDSSPRFRTNYSTPSIRNTLTVCPPLMVTRPPLSMVVSATIVFVPVPVLMSMVTGAGPQLNVTNPPPAGDASRAASVQTDHAGRACGRWRAVEAYPEADKGDAVRKGECRRQFIGTRRFD